MGVNFVEKYQNLVTFFNTLQRILQIVKNKEVTTMI